MVEPMNTQYVTDGKYLFFLTGYLSQWYKIRMTDGDYAYNCAEQYMMAEKAKLFKDGKSWHKIMGTDVPKEQKDLGRQVANFDVDVWLENCKLIVYRGNLLKFSQNLYLKKCLIETRGYTLVETNPTDPLWAIGMDDKHPDKSDPTKWKGKNFLGECLTKVRSDLITMQELR